MTDGKNETVENNASFEAQKKCHCSTMNQRSGRRKNFDLEM